MNKYFFIFTAILVLLMVTVVTPISGAKLEQTAFNAKGENETLLHIDKPGRYSIQVKSEQGTAVTIVDRMAGPYESAGTTGQQDGRIDLLLDSGTYKVRLYSHENGSGQAQLKVFPFEYVKPITRVEELPYLPDLEIIGSSLEDLKQQAFWIEIKERRVLRLEMLGRCLKDARLWRDGSWLEEVKPTISTFERVAGEPMTHIEFHHNLEPGLYLLTCYGGPAQPWTKETNEYPFYLRMGIPDLGTNGQRLLEVSPFGRDTFQVSGETNFFQLDREEKKPAQITVTNFGNTQARFASILQTASITKDSRDPWCIINTSSIDDPRWVTVMAPPGDRLELDYFVQRNSYELPSRNGFYWISSIHSAAGRDAIDMTALLTHPALKTPIKAEVVTITPQKPMVRRVNLLGTLEVFLFIQEEGTYVIDEDPESGAKGSYRLSPFVTSGPRNFNLPPYRDAGSDFELTAGYHMLSIQPKSLGILHFALHEKAGWLNRTLKSVFSQTPAELEKEPQQARRSLLWPEVSLQNLGFSNAPYTLWLNQRSEVESGVIFRGLPLDLQDPLPVPMEPRLSVPIKVLHVKAVRLKITGGKYRLKVDSVPWDSAAPLAPGVHMLELENLENAHRLFNVKSEEVKPNIPPPQPVIKKLEEVFPILTAKDPVFNDFDRQEKKQFLLQVESPALYRLETLGRLATRINVRTRVSTSLYEANQNGVGRNALVQQFLKPGDYLVDVQTLGQSKGRAGIRLARTGLDEITGLTDGAVKRCSVPPDAAIRCRVEIKDAGDYFLETFSLGKSLTYRLEDADGWPLLVPGGSGAVERFFKPGTYFYYSLPLPVESRRVTFLERVVVEPGISGKGPHRLELNTPLENIWLEEANRAPDIYRAEITAPLEVVLSVSGQMEATIINGDGKTAGVTIKGNWSGPLPAGTVEIQVKSPDKNNRMPYTIRLDTNDLVPGLTQVIKSLPAQFNVSLAEDALVNISSFGDVDVKAALWSKEGEKLTFIAGADDIPHDWNFLISRNLKAGQYLLKVTKADKRNGKVNITMQTRKALVLEPQVVPFSVMRTIETEVLKIPFHTTEMGTQDMLLQIKAKNGDAMRLALMKGDVLLAEGEGQLFIPLPGQREYTLLAWSVDGTPGARSVDVSVVKPEEIAVSGSRQTITGRPALRLVNNSGLSFRLKSGDKGEWFYSPLSERPCLPVMDTVEGTVPSGPGGSGWLVCTAPGKQAQLEVFEVKTGGAAEVALSDIPVAFRIEQSQNAPLLLEVKAVNALLGAAVFSAPPRENMFPRTGMLPARSAPSRTLVGIPGKGTYWGHTWLTGPTPPVISEENRFDTGERTNLTLTAFPKQEELDFRAVSSIEAQVEPGRSVWLKLKEEPQVLEMTLARGLVTFSWFRGHALAMAAALEKNEQETMVVQGEILYVLNMGDQPARFRAEKRGTPAADLETLDLENGFERIFDTAGTLQFQLPIIVPGKKLFVAGSKVESDLWGNDGKIYQGVNTAQAANFDMHFYDNTKIAGGFLEIRHGPGLVKVWQAPSFDNGQSFMGDRNTAEKAVFSDGMGTLTLPSVHPQRPQAWEFSLSSPCFISVETPVPTALALVSGNDVLYMSIAAFRVGHRLSYYLPAGTYQIISRILPAPGAPGAGGGGSVGTLVLKTIIPSPLAEGKECPVQIIRPGELQVFRFNVEAEGSVGVGLKTESDTLDAHLLDEKSRPVASGPLILKELPPGTYLLVVETHDVPVQYRPVILGAKGSREGVPDDVIENYKKEGNQ